MQTQKFFDPMLVGRTFLSPYIRCLEEPAPRWWESKIEAKKCARLLAEGLTFWSTIDIVVTITLLFVSLFVTIPTAAILLFITVAIGCPIIMTLGIGYGCLRRLTLRETRMTIRDYFFE